jgi:hypothetical protein
VPWQASTPPNAARATMATKMTMSFISGCEGRVKGGLRLGGGREWLIQRRCRV